MTKNLLTVNMINREIIRLLEGRQMGNGSLHVSYDKRHQLHGELTIYTYDLELSLEDFSNLHCKILVDKLIARLQINHWRIIPVDWDVPFELAGAWNKFQGVSARTVVVPRAVLDVTPGILLRTDMICEYGRESFCNAKVGQGSIGG